MSRRRANLLAPSSGSTHRLLWMLFAYAYALPLTIAVNPGRLLVRKSLASLMAHVSSVYSAAAYISASCGAASWKSLRAIRISQITVGAREMSERIRPTVPADAGISINAPITRPV